MPLAALLAGAAAIGFAPVFVKLAETGPSMTAAWRVLMALPFLWMWMLAEQRGDHPPPQPSTRQDFLGLALAGILFIADLALWHWSLRMTSAANSTLLSNLAPVVVAIVARQFLGERLSRGFLVGLGLALTGALLLVGRSFDFDRQHLRGDLMALATAVFYAGYLLGVKVLRRRFSIATIMAWSGLVSGPGFAVVAWCSGERLLPGSTNGWILLGALALTCHVGGQCLIGYGLGHLPASFSALSLLVQPIVASFLAWAILHEPISWVQAAGGAIILTGIAAASGMERGRPRPRVGAQP